MLYWIYDIPTFAFAALTMVVFVVASWICTFTLRRFVHARIHAKRNANDLVGATFSSFAVLYGLLLGLLAVGAYANFATVDENVSREAASLTVLYHMVSSYPSPVREELQGEISRYTLDTIDRVWPLQQKGIVPPESQDRLSGLYDALLAFKPHDQGEAVTHAETLRTLNEYAELRRGRLVNVRHGLPTILWYVVIVGGGDRRGFRLALRHGAAGPSDPRRPVRGLPRHDHLPHRRHGSPLPRRRQHLPRRPPDRLSPRSCSPAPPRDRDHEHRPGGPPR